MWKLLRFLKPYRKESIFAPLFKLLEVVFELLVPLVVAHMIDSGIGGADKGIIVRSVLLMITLGAVGLASATTAQYFAAKASAGFGANIRYAMMQHIQKRSYAELDQMGTNTMITRITSDVNQVQSGVNMALRLVMRSPFVVIGAMVMAFTVDVKCALIFAAVIPLLAIVVFAIMFGSIPLYQNVQKKLDGILGRTRENLLGVRVLRAFRKEQEEIEHYKRELERLEEETRQKRDKLEEQRDRIIREANEKAHEILADAKETADETMRNFHKFGKANISVAEMEKERERLRKKMNATQNSMKTDAKKPKKTYKASDFKLGESVKVLSMNLTGSVTSLPDAKGNVTVQMGILRSTVNISDLEIIDEAPAYSFAGRTRQTGKGKVKMGKSLAISPEINLLGKTVDEAVAELDKYLDDASLAHLSSVRIVHGKGTGALRAGIHKYLKRQKHVKSFRLGAFGEGDAGVTIAELK